MIIHREKIIPLALIAAFLLSISLTAFALEIVETPVPKEPMQGPFPPPFILTSAGQGPGAALIRAMLELRARREAGFAPLATAEDLPDKGSVLIAIGISEKGMEAAGTSLSDETSRLKELLLKASDNKLAVLLFQAGTRSARQATPEAFLRMAFPYAHAIITKEPEDNRELVESLAEEHSVKLIEIGSYSQLQEVLNSLLQDTE